MSHVTRSCELASTEGQDPLSTCITCGDVEVMTALVGDVREGDALLVHAGTAIARLDR